MSFELRKVSPATVTPTPSQAPSLDVAPRPTAPRLDEGYGAAPAHRALVATARPETPRSSAALFRTQSSPEVGTPADNARRYVKGMVDLARHTGRVSDAETIAGLVALGRDNEAIAFLCTPEGETYRAALNRAFDKIATAHPDAVMPGIVEPSERESLANRSTDDLRRDLGQSIAWEKELGLQPQDFGDLSKLDRGQLIAAHEALTIAVRTMPLGYLAKIVQLNEATARGASSATLAKMATNILAEYGDAPLGLNPWLRNVAAGRG